MPRFDPLTAFTPSERAAWDVFPRLGDAARRGLFVLERVTERRIAAAAQGARALQRALQRKTDK